MDPISLIEHTLNICKAIHAAHQQVKANREQVKLLGERVYAIQHALERIATQQLHAQMIHNLNATHALLREILNFIQIYENKKSWFKRVISAGNDKTRFKEYFDQLQSQMTQMNLSIHVETFAQQNTKLSQAAQQDLQVINTNRQALFELNQIAMQQQNILQECRQDVEQILEQGLYCMGKAFGEAIGSIKQELARRDKVLLGRLDDVHDGIHGLDVAMQDLQFQGRQQKDLILLQLQSMQRQMANGFKQKEKPPIDPKLIIPLCELTMAPECFAKGSFGEIYKAKHGLETVAVKLLPKMDADDELQFLREIEITSRLRSRRTVKLHGASITSGRGIMVLDYYHHKDLRDFLDNHGATLSPEQRLQLMKDIAAGVAYLHYKRIVHRNLKSKNVLIDEYYRAAVSDFGLSHVQKMSVKSIGEKSIAYSWMPPEYFALHGELTSASDIYSLGVIFLEIITNAPPLTIISQIGLSSQMNELRLSQIPDDLTNEVKQLIRCCLAFKAADRPSADVIVDQLDKIVLRPPSPDAQTCYEKAMLAIGENDFITAERWLRTANRKGHAKAASNLGLFSLKKMGADAGNYQQAVEHLKRGAERGDVDAMLNLANVYGYNKYGIEDLNEAMMWASKAVENNHPAAKSLLQKLQTRS